MFSPAPDALRSFLVDDGGVTGNQTAAEGGFSAAISGNSVVLTKNSGAWAAATTVAYAAELEYRLHDGTDTEEIAIMAGALYETWTPDIRGYGLPVLGSKTDGNWTPNFTATVADS